MKNYTGDNMMDSAIDGKFGSIKEVNKIFTTRCCSSTLESRFNKYAEEHHMTKIYIDSATGFIYKELKEGSRRFCYSYPDRKDLVWFLKNLALGML